MVLECSFKREQSLSAIVTAEHRGIVVGRGNRPVASTNKLLSGDEEACPCRSHEGSVNGTWP
jgi:hypothetical protein